MLKACRRRRCKVTHYIKTAQFKGRALHYFILCGKRNTKSFDVICAIVVAYIGRTECRLLSFKPLFSFSIFKCLWGHSHHCQAPKKRRRKKRRTSRSLRPNVKSRYTRLESTMANLSAAIFFLIGPNENSERDL